MLGICYLVKCPKAVILQYKTTRKHLRVVMSFAKGISAATNTTGTSTTWHSFPPAGNLYREATQISHVENCSIVPSEYAWRKQGLKNSQSRNRKLQFIAHEPLKRVHAITQSTCQLIRHPLILHVHSSCNNNSVQRSGFI